MPVAVSFLRPDMAQIVIDNILKDFEAALMGVI